MDGRPVRAYVPILVERNAKARLNARTRVSRCDGAGRDHGHDRVESPPRRDAEPISYLD